MYKDTTFEEKHTKFFILLSLSMHTSLVSDDKQGSMAEEYVNLLMPYAVPNK